MIGFALYNDIFDGSHNLEQDLHDKLVEAYSEFVVMVVEATKYYRGSSRSKSLDQKSRNQAH